MKIETIIKKIDAIVKSNNKNKIILLKIMLDNECKKENPRIDIILKLLNEKIIPDQNTMDSLTIKWKRQCAFRYTIELREQIAELLTNYGYNPTKNDILNLASIDGEFKNVPKNYFEDPIFIKNLEKKSVKNYKFIYKKYFPMNILHEYLFKNKNFLGINNEETKIKIKKIDEILINNCIKPNQSVIKLLCNYECGKSIINFFVTKYKIKPKLETVLECKIPGEIRYLIEKIIKNNKKKVNE
jgi:hypothetical protein